MMTSSSSSASYDPRLLDVVEEIRAAREAGEEVCRDRVLARHPDLAGELGTLFDALDGVRSAGPDHLLLSTVGNYHLLAEVARGGMGVIYQAVQLDLGRPVAVKVLAAGSQASAQARRRFRQEAWVAALLHHTHVVPVYGTACADGHEAYAMPFIDGPSLAEVLRDLRAGRGIHPISQEIVRLHREQRPAYFRQVAELILQAADALAHAHQHGVLHRDVKPANLLVDRGRDGRPHLWLHDFGLARLEGAADFARPGEGFGTRGYQAPEQAAGRLEAIDERSDTYSLGVTLSELLTLRRPDEIAPDARKADPAVPADLALIEAKCRQVRPQDRYASASAVAEDLRRFLHDYPVRARKPGWRQHLLKWSKRHRRALLAAGASFLITALLGAALLWRAYLSEREARRQAEDREELAARAVATYSPLVDDVLFATPELLKRQEKALAEACEVHERLLAARPGEVTRRRWLAQVSWRHGRVLGRLRRHGEAEGRYRQSVALYEGLVKDEPDEPLHRLDLIRSVGLLGDVVSSLNRPDEADEQSARMLDLARQAARDFPDDRRVIDALACYLCARGQALMLRRGQYAAAEPLFREGLAVALAAVTDDPRSRNNVFGNQSRLATALDRQGKMDESLRLSRDARATIKFLFDRSYQGDLPSRKLDLHSYFGERRAFAGECLDRLRRCRRWEEFDGLLRESREAAKLVAVGNPDGADAWLKELDECERKAATERCGEKK